MHQSLKGCACIVQSKWHAGVAVHPAWGEERRFLHILHDHVDLVVAVKGIQEAQQVAFGGGVDNLVNAREREGILRAGHVEVGEVDTHALLPSFLGDDDGVRQPLWVSQLSDDSCVL